MDSLSPTYDDGTRNRVCWVMLTTPKYLLQMQFRTRPSGDGGKPCTHNHVPYRLRQFAVCIPADRASIHTYYMLFSSPLPFGLPTQTPPGRLESRLLPCLTPPYKFLPLSRRMKYPRKKRKEKRQRKFLRPAAIAFFRIGIPQSTSTINDGADNQEGNKKKK